MSEKRILIASLLKPVNDTRMFEKIGLSLCRLHAVQVHIAGFKAPLPTAEPGNIFFHPVFDFKRISAGRAKAQVTYWKLLKQIKPHLLIVGTHELLLLSALYAKLYKCRLIYDIRENYVLNLLEQQHYNQGIRQVLAGGVGFSEKLAAHVTDHFLLAERSYAEELSFIGNKYTIIENKFKHDSNYTQPETPVRIKGDELKLLYSGTIATLYGIFEAITFADSLYEHNPRISLTIMGYCACQETLVKLRQAIEGKPYIHLIGGDRLVPHQDILHAIQTSDVGLMPYHYNKSIFNCIPTKLYEYTAMGLPVLMQANPKWDKLINTFDAGLTIDFNNFNINTLIPTMLNKLFYTNGIPNDVFWASEEQKLIPLIEHFLGIDATNSTKNNF